MSERFSECGRVLRPAEGTVLVFGAAAERELAENVAREIPGARNLAGQTTLGEFIDLVACCRLFLCNDSGAMHVASALGVPTVAVFGATDDVTTGPTGSHAVVVRAHAECSPCLLRECPIDHRCMTRVSVERVVEAARSLRAGTAVSDSRDGRRSAGCYP
jgi:heptosyltransferase-2